MATKSNAKAGTSRIRFIMVDAEIADGDVTSVTHAITSALRGPTPTLVKRIAPPPPPNGQAEPAEPEIVDEVGEEVDAVDVTPPVPRKKAQRRVAQKPAVIPLDVESDPPLSSLGTFKSNHKRYLAIAAWLHDHRNIEVIDERHIYTCYRHLGWPIDIADFAQPLRELKHKQYFESPETGKYAINQLGLAKAKEASAG